MFSTRVLVGIVGSEKFIYEDWTNFKKEVLDSNPEARFKYCSSQDQVDAFYQLCVTKQASYKLKSSLKSGVKFSRRFAKATQNLWGINMIVNYKFAGHDWVVGATLTIVGEAPVLEFSIGGAVQFTYVITGKTSMSTAAINTIILKGGYPAGELCIQFCDKGDFDSVCLAITAALERTGDSDSTSSSSSESDDDGIFGRKP